MSETPLVELVNEGGNPTGSCPVAQAHNPPGRLHRAFSVLLFDPAGRLLMQRRALTKERFAGRWTNSCCSHPAPGEDVIDAARRRLGEELGLRVDGLREVGRFVYRAADPHSGLVEHEYDHVLVAAADATRRPSAAPGEVHSWRWMPPEEVRQRMHDAPQLYSPWLPDVLRLALGRY